MPVRKFSEKLVQFNVWIPEDLDKQIRLFLHDPFTGRLRYGARARIVVEALREYIARHAASTDAISNLLQESSNASREPNPVDPTAPPARDE